MVYHVAADYRLWARRPARDLRIECQRHAESARGGAPRAALRSFVYTSTVATVAVPRGDALPDENTRTSFDEMIGHYKRSKWLAEQEALRAARRWLAGGDRQSDHARRAGRCQAHAHRAASIVDFLNGRMPAYVDAGLNFRARRRRRRGSSAGRRARTRGRALYSGRRELDAASRCSRLLVARLGPDSAARARAACRGPWRRLCRRGDLPPARPRAADSARWRAHGAAQHVRQRRKGAARAGFCSGTGCCGPRACCTLV